MRDKIVSKALAMVGQAHKPGVKFMCANFVSYILSAVGFHSGLYPAAKWHQPKPYTWATWEPTDWAPAYSGVDNKRPMGERIGYGDLQPGDVVLFGNTFEINTSTHIGIYVGNGFMVHRPTADRLVEKAYIADGYWRSKFEVGLRMLPVEVASVGTAGNDGRGAQATERVHRARVEAHSGKASVRVDGQVRPLTRLDTQFSLLGNGRSAIAITLNWDADGSQNLVFNQHDQDGQLKQSLLIDGKAVQLRDVDLELHVIPGKTPGFVLDVVFV